MTSALYYDLLRIRSFVEELGREIVSLQEQPLQIETKEDGSKVTNGDYFSHERLTEFLTRHYPYPIISEEQENPPVFPKGTLWVLDPIDGTSHYLRGEKDYAVMLALVQDREPVMSLVYQPAHKAGYYAEAGKGSYRFTEGKEAEPISIDTRTPPHKRRFLLSGIKAYAGEHAWFTERAIPNYHIKGGIGIKVGAIAEGLSHYYLNFDRPLKVWDVLPSVLIGSEAGAWVWDARGEELRYDPSGYSITTGLCIAPDREILPWLRNTARI